jgi:AhpD family alkylhydroperoxidase
MEGHAHLYPIPTGQLTHKRRELAPGVDHAFREFSRLVFADGALDAKTKQLIAVAVAHVTQCSNCIRGHTKAARHEQATEQQIVEAIWVAAEMRAGGAVAHSLIAVQAMEVDGQDGQASDTRCSP